MQHPLQLQSLPPALRPLARAYLVGYASAVGPRLVALALQHLASRKTKTSIVEPVLYVLRTALEPQRFPAFCAILVGGSTLLQDPLKSALDAVAAGLDNSARLRIARWLASFVAAWSGLRLLHSKQSTRPTDSACAPSGDAASRNKSAGRTVDLTLFATTQAVDVIVGELWSRHRARRMAARKWTGAEQLISYMIDPLVFVASCGPIMWAWIYTPDRLPPAYNKWITSAAQVDLRLVEALRRCRNGDIRYTEETGQAALLGSMCRDYNLPYEWGNPVTMVPFPCEIVHMGRGPSCEYHAWRRFCLSWTWSMYTYLSLALVLQLRKPTRNSLILALISASRSSAFLAAFVTLFYYGVCIGRTRVGPHLIGRDVSCRNRIDGGLCVGAGCFFCGWSVLIETATRRKDMALFVAPRAMATLLPRRYSVEKQWRETLAFAASTAVVFTCALENPKRVRGVMGGILAFIMRE